MDDLAQPGGPGAGAAAGHPERWRILAVLDICLVMVVMAVSSLNVAIPTLIRDLAASPSQIQWIVDAYALVFAGLLLPCGALGDRFGRKGALLTGLGVFAAAALASTLADDAAQLIGARAVMGVGAALIMPATLSIITTVFPAHERPKAIATWAAFAGAGGALGPVISGLLLSRFWWGSIFFINVPVALVAAGLIVRKAPTSRDPAEARLDPLGAGLSVLGFGTLLYGIIQGPEHGWTSGSVLGAFALGAAALGLFVWVELRSAAPMLDPRLFKIPAFAMGSWIITAVFFGMFGFFFLISQYLQLVKGYSPLRAAFATLPSAATMIAVAPRAPALAGRLGAKRSVSVALLLVAVGLGLCALLRPGTPYLAVAPILVLLAAGSALTMPVATSAIVSSLPLAKAGVGSAVNDTTREVGGALGIAVLGSILSSGYRASAAGLAEGLPANAAPLVRDSLGGALRAAETALPVDLADTVLVGARAAFADGTQAAFAVAAAVMVVTALAVIRWFPAAAHLHRGEG